MPLPPLSDQKPHDLDFDYPDFLTFSELPPTEYPMRGWVFLATFVRDESIGRPVFRVQDTSGRQIPVAFYIDDRKALSEIVSKIKIGSSILSILGAQQHHFFDGQVGLRIENGDLPNLRVRYSSLSNACYNLISIKILDTTMHYCTTESYQHHVVPNLGRTC